MAATPAIGERLGERLRAEREARGLTLRELAGRLGISASALSQIETGRSRPSVGTLYALVGELGISVDALLGAPRIDPAAMVVRALDPDADVVQRGGKRRIIALESGVVWQRLNPLSDHDVEFLEITYPPGAMSSAGASYMRHVGREYGIVRSGRLRVAIGYEEFVLGPGDSICFDSEAPHRLETVGDEAAVAIWCVIGRDGNEWRTAT